MAKIVKAPDLAGLTLLRSSQTVPPPSPDQAVLETFPNRHPQRDYEVSFDCPEFTSVCPVTGQPDFGRITIRYIPDRSCIESKSLKYLLLSFRNHPTFHEEAVNRVLDAVVRGSRPHRGEVIGEFRPRGGIAITVRAVHEATGKKRNRT